jgi:Domain of unknown function (DUF5911)
MDGSIDFMSFPRFDSPTVFAALLDAEKGGRFQIAPILGEPRQKQLYLPDSNMLLTREDSKTKPLFRPVAAIARLHRWPDAAARSKAWRGGGRRTWRRLRGRHGAAAGALVAAAMATFVSVDTLLSEEQTARQTTSQNPPLLQRGAWCGRHPSGRQPCTHQNKT